MGHRLRRPLPRHVRLRVFEHATGRLVLARDRLGIKPLYLDQRRDRLRFASTLPALLAGGGVDTSIDRTALAHYMTFHSRRPRAAHDPRPASASCRRPRCGWSSPTAPAATPSTGRRSSPATRAGATGPRRDWEEALLEKLRVAVDRRMVADVPVGVLLSGGIDSSLVVALLAEAGQTGLSTFSIGFDSVPGSPGRRARRCATGRSAVRFVLIDVRPRAAYDEGHIPGAAHLDPESDLSSPVSDPAVGKRIRCRRRSARGGFRARRRRALLVRPRAR